MGKTDQVRQDLSQFNFTQKYARYLPEKKRRETWEEACDRVLDMHLKRYADKGPVVKAILKDASKLEKKKRVLSSQRARQFGGEPTLLKNWRIYNCTTSYCDRVRFFQEAFWLLLCGCGVGFSVQEHHVAQLPKLLPLSEWQSLPKKSFKIPDTIEGWADALGMLISSRVGTLDYVPEFNYSLIRPAGSPISIGGKAPGPIPLQTCLDRINTVLSSCEDRLTTVQCFDIVMFASDAVLSGGVRRAASIALFSAHDSEMANAKTGNWYTENPQRARANISAVITPDTTREQYDWIFSRCKEYGEPGFIFTQSREFVYNPCVEIGMAPVLIKTPAGYVVDEYSLNLLENKERYRALGFTYESGWQACNLTEVNCAAFTDEENAIEAVKAATILGTAQAGYTSSLYLTDVSRQILEREALIGVSLTGMANSPSIAFNEEWQKRAAYEVKNTNRRFAEMIGIKQAARTTCVKPSGNAAVLLGCASGVHPEYAERYIRRVQVSRDNPIGQFFEKTMPSAVEKSAWSAPGTEDLVLSFPILNDDDEHTVYRKDLSAYAFIDFVLLTQRNWVRSGVARDTVHGLTHNVSNTILVQADEWDAVSDKLWRERRYLSGVSLLSAFGDYDYEQAPFQEVYEPRHISKSDPLYDKKLTAFLTWSSLRKEWKSPIYTRLKEKEDATSMQAEPACVGGACEFTLGV